MTRITNMFEESAFNPAVEIGQELLEVGVDSILEDGVLKDIPIVGSIFSLCKVGVNIHERNLLMQTIAFIKALNDGSVDREKLEAYKEKLKSNRKKAESELGRILVIINRQIDNIRSYILGKLYQGYIDEKISWNKLCEFSEVNERMFVIDYMILNHAYNKKGIDVTDKDAYQIDRLISLGLLENHNRISGNLFMTMLDEDGNEEIQHNSHVVITSFGKIFCKQIDINNVIRIFKNSF